MRPCDVVVEKVNKPNFSGLWQANLRKSHMRAPAPGTLMMKIAHGEDALRQAILITRPDGTQDRHVVAYSMTDAETVTEVRGAPLRSRVRWNGAEMVVESAFGASVFRDCWWLSEDGQTLTMEHRDDAIAGQKTVLELISDAAHG